MSDQKLLSKILRCSTLPSLPAVAIEVLEVTRDEQVPLPKIAEVVQNDQAITSRILKTVNSSYYGLAKPCPTITRALAYLGLNTVKSLVLGFSLVDTFGRDVDETDEFDHIGYWRRAIYSATAARALARIAGVVDPEEAFIAALLQDIGMLALNTSLGSRYAQVCKKVAGVHEFLPRIERESLDLDHCEVGARLAESWHLPDELVKTICWHHHPEKAPRAHRERARLVALGNSAAAALNETMCPLTLETYRREAEAMYSLDHEQSGDLLIDITSGAVELARLFKVRTGDRPEVESLLVEAQDALLGHQIVVSRESNDLRRSNSELARKSVTDGLTGAFNRRRFDQTLGDEIESAHGSGASVAIIFLDADHFKSVNDTHGHPVGDVVLIEMARRLTALIGDEGVVCRYGGEEFAVVLPTLGRVGAARLAESVRRTIESPEFDVAAAGAPVHEIRVTVSIGVAAFEPSVGPALGTAGQLIQAVDKAVYGAKSAGRNCVRVFSPRVVAPPDTAFSKQQPPPPPPPPPTGAFATHSHAATDPGVPPTVRVLVIESDDLHATYIQTALASLAGSEMVHVTSGRAGLNMLRNGIDGNPYPADLVLLGFRQPDLTAVEVLQEIKKPGALRAIPVVVLSESENDEDVSACLNAGANAYICKSSLVDDPVTRIRQIAEFWSQTRRVA